MFDFSILSNIDFTNKDNLIFLALFAGLALILFFILLSIASKIIWVFRRIIYRMFNINGKRPKFDKKNSTDWLHRKSKKKIVDTTSSKQQDPAAKPVDNFEKIIGQTGKLNNSFEAPMPAPVRPLAENYSGLVKAPTDRNSIELPNSSGAGGIKNTTVFGGESEISKRELEYKMKNDAEVWKASKAVGLNMSRAERAEIIKKTFSSAYGRNISKTDLKSGIRKLNQKMMGTTDAAEHSKIRKEVKFLKKIGGIKN